MGELAFEYCLYSSSGGSEKSRVKGGGEEEKERERGEVRGAPRDARETWSKADCLIMIGFTLTS